MLDGGLPNAAVKILKNATGSYEVKLVGLFIDELREQQKVREKVSERSPDIGVRLIEDANGSFKVRLVGGLLDRTGERHY